MATGKNAAQKPEAPKKEGELGRPIRELFSSRSTVKGKMFGVEVEIEGVSLPKSDKVSAEYWRCTTDGSLKGLDNVEYVLAKPMTEEEAVVAVKALYALLASNPATKVDSSMRAGVHVHINCGDLSVKQFFTFLAAYYALEVPLTNNFGPDRIGNLFCQRLVDCEYTGYVINMALKQPSRMRDYFATDNIRYAAANLMALVRYNSLEFRALKTPQSPEQICDWISTLSTLYDSCLKYDNPAEILQMFSADGEEQATERLLGVHSAALIKQPNFKEDLFTGIRATQFWVFANKWNEEV